MSVHTWVHLTASLQANRYPAMMEVGWIFCLINSLAFFKSSAATITTEVVTSPASFSLKPEKINKTRMKMLSVLKVRQYYLKRLRLGKTTGWQHRFFEMIILSPIWLGTYEYMKSFLENFFFSVWNRASRVDFSDLVKNFQIWPSFCVHQKIIILSILGAGKG